MIGRKEKKSLAQKKKAVPPAYDNLKDTLIRFLNIEDFGAIKPDDALGHELNMLLDAHLFSDRRDPEHLKFLQRTIARSIMPIAQPVPRRDYKSATAEQKLKYRKAKNNAERRVGRCLERLIQKLNKWHFDTRFCLLPSVSAFGDRYDKNLTAENRVFHWRGDANWIIKFNFGVTSTRFMPASDLWGIIAEALLTGRLALVRRCPHCKRFFLAEDSRERFCPQHAEAYHKRNAAKRVKAWRKLHDP